MNTLVAYDSSSDEDSAIAEPKTSAPEVPNGLNHAGNISSSNSIPTTNSEHVTVVAEGPVMGPLIPPQENTDYSIYADGIEYQDENNLPVAERDLIRHLTQTTHPMSEMPPSPPGSPDAGTTTKFKRFLELKAKGVHFNEDLARKDVFKNPSLLSTLMNRAGIDEVTQYQTSLPRSVFDATSFPPYAYKEELLKSQQKIHAADEAEKKAKSASGKRTIDFTPAGTSDSLSSTSAAGQQPKRKKI